VTWPSSPPWLLQLQARFGEMLRAPLDRSTGQLRADTTAYEAALVEAVAPSPTVPRADRLAVYHRQYWFRLFTVLHGLYPLTTRLIGHWRFNDLAAAHLMKRPPRGVDIDTIGEHLELSLAEWLETTDASLGVDAAAVAEAARVDAAFHRVTRAPHGEPFRPGPADAPRFADSCLRLSPGVALVEERWPSCELRLSLLERPSADAIRLGSPWPAPRTWLLARHASKLGLLALETLEAELLQLLQQYPLALALGKLEAGVPFAERESLPERTQAWLARSVRLGVWAGFVEAREHQPDSR